MQSTGAADEDQKWSARFPVYQMDFTSVAAGKRIATSKRRVKWRFGFSNADAIDAGQTGTSCRGREHDVTIVWSISSGKRLILVDGQEVHYSTVRSNVLEHSWTMKGNHVLKVLAYAVPSKDVAGARQYDLSVDGQSFFHMPKVRLLLIMNGSQNGIIKIFLSEEIKSRRGGTWGRNTHGVSSILFLPMTAFLRL